MGRVFRILVLGTLLMAGWGTGAVSGQSVGIIPGPSSGSSIEAADFEALFHARADSARMRFIDADVHFIEMMIHHHGQALEMSALAGDRTTNPEILTLAGRIAGGQEEEIARMRQWLESRGLTEAKASPEVGAPNGVTPSSVGQDHTMHDMPGMGAMPGMGEMPGMHSAEHTMPGLLTSAEMEELAGATGSVFDRLYLSYMIYHHRGAMQMVDELFSTPGAAQGEEIFQLASEIHTDQNTEVARMERMLATLALPLHIH